MSLMELPDELILSIFRRGGHTVQDFRLVNQRLLAYLYLVPLSLDMRRVDYWHTLRALAFMQRFRGVTVVVPEAPAWARLVCCKRGMRWVHSRRWRLACDRIFEFDLVGYVR